MSNLTAAAYRATAWLGAGEALVGSLISLSEDSWRRPVFLSVNENSKRGGDSYVRSLLYNKTWPMSGVRIDA